jgi:hypothetical protein
MLLIERNFTWLVGLPASKFTGPEKLQASLFESLDVMICQLGNYTNSVMVNVSNIDPRPFNNSSWPAFPDVPKPPRRSISIEPRNEERDWGSQVIQDISDPVNDQKNLLISSPSNNPKSPPHSPPIFINCEYPSTAPNPCSPLTNSPTACKSNQENSSCWPLYQPPFRIDVAAYSPLPSPRPVGWWFVVFVFVAGSDDRAWISESFRCQRRSRSSEYRDVKSLGRTLAFWRCWITSLIMWRMPNFSWVERTSKDHA